MAKVLLFLITLFAVAIVCVVIFDKFIHPWLFKEELEDTLESAAEEKIRREVKSKANKLLGGNSADSKK